MTLDELFSHKIRKRQGEESDLESELLTENGHPLIASCHNLTETRLVACWNACAGLDTATIQKLDCTAIVGALRNLHIKACAWKQINPTLANAMLEVTTAVLQSFEGAGEEGKANGDD